MPRHTIAQERETTMTPLQVSTAPLPSDIRLHIAVAPDAPLGQCDVQVGLGRGSKGKGTRVGDDPAVHVSTVRALAAHLLAYAAHYEQAAATEEPDWPARLAIAAAAVRPGRSTLCPCGQPTTNTEYCDGCIPF